MSDRNEDRQSSSGDGDDHHMVGSDKMLETHITRILHVQAARVHFSPDLRERVLRRLPAHRTTRMQRYMAPALSLAALLIIAFSLTAYFLLLRPQLQASSSRSMTAIYYIAKGDIPTPDQLSHGGRPVAIDPTSQHLVYALTQQPGVMYTTNLSTPLKDNTLAMRDARDVSWAPDGSGLVTTIYPQGTYEPLLALVPTGKFMHLLGHEALASAWSPVSSQQITYVTQSKEVAQIWTTDTSGHTNTLVASLQQSELVQRIVWSPDGRQLALVTTNTQRPSPQALNAYGHAIYLMDAASHQERLLITLRNAFIGGIGWSPDSHYLTYEQIDAQGHISLHALNLVQQRASFTLPLLHQLLGWSWSPDSRALAYSDNGVLNIHVLAGRPIVLPHIRYVQAYPLWLKDGRILYMRMTGNTGTLSLLGSNVKK